MNEFDMLDDFLLDRICFNVYDLNGMDGYITREEMYQFLKHSMVEKAHGDAEDDADDSTKDLTEIILKKLVTAEQELCLQLHKEFLTEEMDSVDVVQRLRSQFILSSNDEEYILGTAGTLRHQGDALNESGYDDEVSYLLDRVDELSGSVEGIKKHLEVLSIRITKVDSGRQVEIDRLKRELDKARAELERLREMESENDSLQRRFKDPNEKSGKPADENEQQAYSKLNDLEKEVVDQRQQHKKELDDQRQQHRKDIDQFRRRIDREKERRMHMGGQACEVEEHKQHSDTVMKRMQEKFLEMREKCPGAEADLQWTKTNVQ
nr:hypothetical protein BaRGS_030887 [Batillaria attramentaria]